MFDVYAFDSSSIWQHIGPWHWNFFSFVIGLDAFQTENLSSDFKEWEEMMVMISDFGISFNIVRREKAIQWLNHTRIFSMNRIFSFEWRTMSIPIEMFCHQIRAKKTIFVLICIPCLLAFILSFILSLLLASFLLFISLVSTEFVDWSRKKFVYWPKYVIFRRWMFIFGWAEPNKYFQLFVGWLYLYAAFNYNRFGGEHWKNHFEWPNWVKERKKRRFKNMHANIRINADYRCRRCKQNFSSVNVGVDKIFYCTNCNKSLLPTAQVCIWNEKLCNV